MTATQLNERPPTRRSLVGDDLSYLLPMVSFVGLTQLSVWYPEYLPYIYIGKTLVVAAMLVLFWPAYTKVRWTHLHWGVIVGVLGIVQWIGMEKLLLHFNYWRMHVEPFNPFETIPNPAARYAFIAVRWAGASLMVPVMEELFWRDYAWRTLAAPNDFKLASVGEWDRNAFLVVPIVFSLVHVQWLTAIVWALMIGVLLLRTKSLGACMVAHGLTNFLLGAYVLWTHDWYFW